MVQKVLKSLVVFCLLSCQYIMAQTATVKGTITDANSGMPLPSATVIVKGTSNGVSSDFDGNYSIKIESQPKTLVFSYIGYSPKEVEFTGQETIDVSLVEDFGELEEIVVTALGIKREKKALTYSAQTISTEEFSEARSLNVSNSLAGKVAGLNFSSTGTGVGGSSRVTLRGNRSLNGNNQPLYVIDGVPIDNTVSSPNVDIGGVTSFDGISSINPEDIESISVLKGASASALYGFRAANGAIVITTKKGTSDGKARVTVSSNLMFSNAFNLLNQQNEYGQGSNGVYDPVSPSSWGPKMNGQSVEAWQLSHNPNYSGPANYALNPQPNNAIDFFKSGINMTNSIAASMGNDKIQGYFSYTYTNAEGIVVGNELNRHNANLRLTSDLSDKLKLDVKTNFISQSIDNAIGAGEAGIGESLYTMPRSLPYDQYRDYEYVDDIGELQYNYINAGTLSNQVNPFWLANRNLTTDERNRVLTFASLTYNFTDALSLMVRSGLDQITDKNKNSRHAAVAVINQDFGSYSERIGEISELNSDFLLSYKDKIGDDFGLDVNFGGSALTQKNQSLSSGGALTRRNFFSLTNLQTTTVNPVYIEKRVNSLYSFAQVSFKDYIFLDLTGRNDWYSTLSSDNRSQFYPSAGLTFIITDMFNINSKVLSFLKLRGSYAEVGNDADPYSLYPTLQYFGFNGGVVQSATVLNNENLVPELSKSVELGLDARLFNNRLGLDVTLFRTNTLNQSFRINLPESSGFAQEYVNGGDIQNTGIEVVLNGTPVRTQDFSWDVTANFAKYESEILSILDDREELSLVTGGERLANNKVIVGGEYGDLYIRGFQRNDNGDIIVNAETGLPEFTSGFDVYAGNFNPDWTAGLTNEFNYKNFRLSFLVDFRMGGEVISYSQVRMAGTGTSDMTLEGRENGFVVEGVNANGDGTFSTNQTSISAQDYWSNVASRDPRSAEDFVFDATNIRLRELVFGYSLPDNFLENTPFTGVNLSVVGRNLLFFKNEAKYFDPEQGVSVGNLQGIESFNIPSTKDVGFNVKLNF